jgi:tRNA-(ms[2]io[6]A)-hydroxylase
MIDLRVTTPLQWAENIVQNLDLFLPDHAAAEKKASSMALTMVAHYPNKADLVAAMIDLAVEELNHFRSVVTMMNERGLVLLPDQKDPYVNRLRRLVRHGEPEYLMDRLLVGGIVEARGAERFGLIAEALPEGQMKQFYQAITRSELEHRGLFYQLAKKYGQLPDVQNRLDELLDSEAEIVSSLPIRTALH